MKQRNLRYSLLIAACCSTAMRATAQQPAASPLDRVEETYRAGRFAEAADALRLAQLVTRTDSARAAMLVGRLAARRGDQQTARAELARALVLDPLSRLSLDEPDAMQALFVEAQRMVQRGQVSSAPGPSRVVVEPATGAQPSAATQAAWGEPVSQGPRTGFRGVVSLIGLGSIDNADGLEPVTPAAELLLGIASGPIEFGIGAQGAWASWNLQDFPWGYGYDTSFTVKSLQAKLHIGIGAPRGAVRPFLGVAVGRTWYFSEDLYQLLLGQSSANSDFDVAASLGIRLPTSRSTAVRLFAGAQKSFGDYALYEWSWHAGLGLDFGPQ